MASELLYEEIQSSGNKSVRDFAGIMAVIFIGFVIYNLVIHKGNFNGFTAVLLIVFSFSMLVFVASYIRLITQIRADGIYVKFPPFQSSFTRYDWNSILDVYVREFEPFSEYMGWGIRTGPMGKAYIISGNTGIQIVFRNKQRLLISTRKPEEIKEVLLKIMRK
ncbi:MAG: DUF6141 family protein [Flavisolibacter sp.]|jgi:hypothetical protein